MPRVASRITLEILTLGAERLQKITRAGARAEGFDPQSDFADPLVWFRDLWDQLNADRGLGWVENPWVWVVSFRVTGIRESGMSPGRAGGY
jgi:hypothetical protein